MSSTTTTPTRAGRGVPLPDIDTRAPISKSATALSMGGWLTPPQSAHESRRGSLAHSFISDAPFSSASSMSAFSTPATPVHLTGHINDPFSQRWSQHSANHAQMPSDISGLYADANMSQDMLHSDVELPGCVPEPIHGMPIYTDAGHRHTQGPFDMHMSTAAVAPESWQEFGQPTDSSTGHNMGLQSTLYQSHPGMTVGSGPIPSSYANHNPDLSALSLDTSSATQYGGYGPASASFCQHPQVVVPSQLSPAEDWTVQPYPGYASPEQNCEDFSSSFASNSTSFSAYDNLTPPSPDDDYFAASEDDGYLLIKPEPLQSPTPGASQLRYRSSGVARTSSDRRRRSSKRGKLNEPRAYYRNDKFKTLVVYEGKWRFGEGGEAFLDPANPPSKPHKCPDCTAKFERSEHLKRHQKTHTDTREYPCPLPGCDRVKGISRSDNATDHFKTHLKGPRKGQRNKHFEFPELRSCILRGYTAKEAQKMLSKLEKACREDHELLGQRHHFL